jgi:hypothetical protein
VVQGAGVKLALSYSCSKHTAGGAVQVLTARQKNLFNSKQHLLLLQLLNL